MDKQKLKKDVERLTKELDQHNFRYYVLDEPTISDQEYDLLLKQLMAIEEKHPELVSEASPTKRIGAKVLTSGPVVTHKAKMYSLDNTYSFEELKSWHERVLKGLKGKAVEYTVELKIDGVSAALT